MKISETTFNRFNQPDDGTGIAGDDDRPPGNILLGTRYKRTSYFNKLTNFSSIWTKDDSMDWAWDFFDSAKGMEDRDNYSKTIDKIEKILPQETWKSITSHFRFVPDVVVTKRFKDKKQPHRSADDVLGKLEYDKNTKDKRTNEDLIKKIDDFLSK